jgi:hypothetical protein
VSALARLRKGWPALICASKIAAFTFSSAMASRGMRVSVDVVREYWAISFEGPFSDADRSMGSEILQPESQDEEQTSKLEVEFALVLSRMIDSVRNDPEHLRATIYELARVKIREQSRSETLAERRQLSKALETAIQGVETFVKKAPANVLLRPEWAGHALPPPEHADVVRPAPQVIEAESPNWRYKRTASRLSTLWRFGIVLAITSGIVLAITQRETLRIGASRVATMVAPAPPPVQVAPAAPPAATTAVPEPSPTTPTTYGVYAVSEAKLYELEMLPGRAPDIRVTVSPAIQTPSRTVLPNGRLKFVIYRRDSATSAADHAEVRIVARVAEEMGFDAAGKPVARKIDDTWVMRNISIPFRVAPKRDNPDMYEVLGETPDSTLTPGRYALVLKGQAYDFSVDGSISDERQCLQRMAATNGQFYSACAKP